MPGIVGLITRLPREVAEAQVRQMVNAMRQDHLDVAGICSDASLGVYVGWVARKGSFSASMPLENERGDRTLIFSGEEFPNRGTARSLKEKGHVFQEEGADYLVHLSEEDASFPAGLNGMFQGLLIDRKSERAVLFNDRYGMHRVYYHQAKDGFYFAAEAKSILAVRHELRELNYESLGEFVSCGAVLNNRSIFQGIDLLPQASAWVFRNKTVAEKTTYFQPEEWEAQEPLQVSDYYEQLHSSFSKNISHYFMAREAIGMSLTGGLDTRMVMAARNPAPGTLPCYTYGSMFGENEDVRAARRVAEICWQPYQVLTAGHNFLAQFSSYAERAVYLTDGCVDVSRSPDLYLSELAREIAPVRMTGLYGGEVLRGFVAFKPGSPSQEIFAPEFLTQIQRTTHTYKDAREYHPISFAAFRQGPWFLYGALKLEQSQLSVRTPFLDNDFVKTVFRAPASTWENSDICSRLIADGNPALLSVPTDRGLTLDSAGMSGNARHAWKEFFFKAEYAYDMGMPQWLARADHAVSWFRFERLFLGRHKPFHFRNWYRNALAEYVKAILLDPRSLARPYVDRKGVEAAVLGHVKGNRNYTIEIHKLLTLELIHRVFLDGSDRLQRDGDLCAPAVPVLQ